MSKSPRKTFILDTNVLLYDPNSIYKFEENDVIIPIIVLEELDNFKKGSDVINLNARQVIRELNSLSADTNSLTFKLGESLGNLKIQVDGYEVKNTSPIFTAKSKDNQILTLVLNLHKEDNVVFVTKDINLRMKAKAFGIEVIDYEIDSVDTTMLYNGLRSIQGCDEKYIDLFYSKSFVECDNINDPVANEYFVLKNGKQSALARFNPFEKKLERVIENKVAGISNKNVEQLFAIDALMNPEIELVTLTGKAGTGKTLLALASAIESRRSYHQIFLARPPVPLSNKDLGFLPGSLEDKISPYMKPLEDNLTFIRKAMGDSSIIDNMKSNNKIEISALPYLRGRSLPNIYFIVDEAQNLTPHEIKTIITRAGEGTKLVFTGDIYQIDSPYLDERTNGLSYLISKMKGQDIFAHINLVKGERSKLAELASNVLN